MGGESDKRPDAITGADPATNSGRGFPTGAMAPRTTADLLPNLRPKTTAEIGAGIGLMRVTADRLNVRSAPQVDPGNVLGGLEQGQVVRVVALAGDWVQINFDSRVAYVSQAFVEPTTTPNPATESASPQGGDASAAPAAPAAGSSAPVVVEPLSLLFSPLPPQPASLPSGSICATRVPGKDEFATASGNVIAQTTPAEAAILNQLRRDPRRLDPTWLMSAQHALGVQDATGAMNTETLRAMRERAHKPKFDASGIMDEVFLSTLAPGSPFFQGTTLGFADQDADPTATTPADLAAQAAGYPNYAAYRETWVPIKFLGRPMGPPVSHGSGRGHPYLAARLQVAEAFLRQRHPNPQGDAGIIKAIGWNGRGNAAYDDDAKLMMSHPHTMGLAVDFDPGHNVYLFNEHVPGLKHEEAMWWIHKFEELSKIATRIYGGEPIKPDVLYEWTQKTSTEELFQRVTATSEAFAKLFQLSKKPAAEIMVTLTNAGFSADEAATELPNVQTADERFHQGGGRENASQLTNLHEELVLALRDAAGLSWGGTDMSMRENGDFMHFDCRDTDFGHAVGAKKAPHKDK